MPMTPQLWSVSALAVEFRKDRRTVGKMLADVPPAGEVSGSPAWRLADVAVLRGAAPTGGGDADELTAERIRKTREEADALELANQVRRGELIERAQADAGAVGAFAHARARVLAMPSKLAPLVAPVTDPAECQAILQRGAHEICTSLAATSVAELCGDHGDVVEDMGAAPGPDGQPVGGREAAAKPRGKRRARKVGHEPG